ncbi:MAG: DUF4199 domain-containing protein [Leeuwenhoekiella sp.]
MGKVAIEIKWAIIFTVLSLIWMVFEKSMGWHDENIADHAIYTNFFGLVAVLVYVMAIRDKRDNYYGGVMTWKQGFFSGFILSAFVAIISPLAQYITHEWITPNYFKNVIAYAVNTGEQTQEEAEAYFNLGSYILQSVIFAFVIGLLTSAVVALFVRRK